MFFRNYRDKREIKKLRKMLKKVDHTSLPLFKSVSSKDAIHSLKYLLISKLKEKVLNLEHVLIKKRKQKSVHLGHIDYLEHKLQKLPSKIKIFEADFSEEEFKKICSLLLFVEVGVKNV